MGQAAVKRAAEIAVAGGHNLLLIGPPGSEKALAAERIAGILPPMTLEESMEITKIYSICENADSKEPLVDQHVAQCTWSRLQSGTVRRRHDPSSR